MGLHDLPSVLLYTSLLLLHPILEPHRCYSNKIGMFWPETHPVVSSAYNAFPLHVHLANALFTSSLVNYYFSVSILCLISCCDLTHPTGNLDLLYYDLLFPQSTYLICYSGCLFFIFISTLLPQYVRFPEGLYIHSFLICPKFLK